MDECPRDIDVVLTCRDYGRYLAKCLRSVLEQSLPPRRVVLVDDGSVDETPEVARGFPEVEYHRVALHSASRARNFGFGRSSAPWVVFFDCDNFMAPHFLRVLREAARADPGAAFVYCDRINFGEGDASWYPGPLGLLRSRPFDADVLRDFNYVDVASLLRADRFPGFDPAFDRFDDWDLWLRIAAAGGRGRYVPQPLFYYRLHASNATRRLPYAPALERIRRRHGPPRTPPQPGRSESAPPA